MSEFEVSVSKADFKFNCAHFIAFKGFREKLHGHNYTASIRVVGNNALGSDGYVIDFGDIKKVARQVCKQLNELFICPILSDAINIKEENDEVKLECEDGTRFSFPRGDCAMLPIVHSSAEEMSRYLWSRFIEEVGLERLLSRGIALVEVSVSESPLQTASFRCRIPESQESLLRLQEEWQLSAKRMQPVTCLPVQDDSV